MDPAVETSQSGPDKRPWFKKPLFWGALGVVLVVLAVVLTLQSTASEPANDSSAELNTASVVIADLVDESTYEGTLGRPEAEPVTAGFQGGVTFMAEPGSVIGPGEELFAVNDNPVYVMSGSTPSYRDLSLGDTQITVPAGRQGTLTWLVDEGEVVETGDVFARIDQEPVVAFDGSVPMYRVLRSGVEGEDVQQLEEQLVALGYDPDGEVEIDEEFDSATADMVERWQEELGVSENGRVSPGEIIFAPLPAQVLSQSAAVGVAVTPTTPVLTASGGDELSGPDVRQLEEGLTALGYDPGTVDGVYDTETASAVSEFTVDKGLSPEGWLPNGTILFRADPIRVSEHLVSVGASVAPQTAILSAAPEETIVRLDLPAEDQELMAVGTPVIIVLPDRSEFPGSVIYVSSVAETSQQGGGATFDVEIALDDPSVADGLDEAPVDVRVVADAVEDVVAVPVSALLALAEGGYAVEVVEGDTTRLVAVDPGFFGDGLVEVAGALDPGMTVVVP